MEDDEEYAKLRLLVEKYEKTVTAANLKASNAYRAARDRRNEIYRAAHAKRDEVCRSAHVEDQKARTAAWKECYETYDAATMEHQKARDAVGKECYETCDAAWAEFASVNIPVVQWMVVNCENYIDECIEVFNALPATVEQLDGLADRYGWCPVWDRFRDAAIGAGVIQR